MQQQLTTNDIYDVLRQTLPSQNDFVPSKYVEELQELLDFEVNTKLKFLDLISKHRQRLLELDQEPLDDYHVSYYKIEYGDKFVEDRIENQFWFAYPALIRILLELEFGDRYRAYSDEVDEI